MKHNDWTEQMRQRLDNAEADVPDMLWSAIEQKLDEQQAADKGAPDHDKNMAAVATKPHAPQQHARTTTQQRGRTAVLWRWAVAASVALVGGAAMWWHTTSDNNALPHDARLQGIVAYDNGHAATQVKATDMSRLADGGAAAVAHRAYNSTAKAALGETAPTAACAETGALAECYSEATPASSQTQNEEEGTYSHAQAATHDTQTAMQKQQAKKAKQVPPTAMLRPEAHGSAAATDRQARWQVGACTSGNMTRYSSAGGVMPVVYSSKQNDGFGNMLYAANPMQRDIKEKTRHNMPLSFGLTASYRLTDRWSLSSGAVYTIATSSFEHGTSGSVSTDEQTLHYIGIPVNASYEVWGNSMLKTYVTAGAQADFNVAAKVDTDGHSSDMRKDRVQMSVGGGLGLQLNFVKQVGIYVEPGVKYYFDNGSSVQNVFKEHPCNFSLQVGLRYNIK